MNRIVASHSVEVWHITQLQPLLDRNGSLASPSAGFTICLEGGRSFQWLADDRRVPQIGDFFITDSQLGVDYVVAAKTFAEMFREK